MQSLHIGDILLLIRLQERGWLSRSHPYRTSRVFFFFLPRRGEQDDRETEDAECYAEVSCYDVLPVIVEEILISTCCAD
jgi:hypothetical protein